MLFAAVFATGVSNLLPPLWQARFEKLQHYILEYSLLKKKKEKKNDKKKKQISSFTLLRYSYNI